MTFIAVDLLLALPPSRETIRLRPTSIERSKWAWTTP